MSMLSSFMKHETYDGAMPHDVCACQQRAEQEAQKAAEAAERQRKEEEMVAERERARQAAEAAKEAAQREEEARKAEEERAKDERRKAEIAKMEVQTCLAVAYCTPAESSAAGLVHVESMRGLK